MLNILLSIIGVVFLAVLIDFIYPNGKTNTFCKSIFGLFAIIMLIQPILKLDLKTNNINENFVSASLNQNIQKSKDEYYKLKIEKKLEDENIIGIDVEIESKMLNNVYEINNINVDSTNVVLTENLTHTNKYEVIIQNILKIVEIDKERIVIYG